MDIDTIHLYLDWIKKELYITDQDIYKVLEEEFFRGIRFYEFNPVTNKMEEYFIRSMDKLLDTISDRLNKSYTYKLTEWKGGQVNIHVPDIGEDMRGFCNFVIRESS